MRRRSVTSIQKERSEPEQSRRSGEHTDEHRGPVAVREREAQRRQDQAENRHNRPEPLSPADTSHALRLVTRPRHGQRSPTGHTQLRHFQHIEEQPQPKNSVCVT
jgi:hypothetical protein